MPVQFWRREIARAVLWTLLGVLAAAFTGHCCFLYGRQFESNRILSAESNASYNATVARACNDSAAIADPAQWEADYGSLAVEGLGRSRRMLERRTARILDRGVRDAGNRFLAAIQEQSIDGKISYRLDRDKLAGIDQDKLRRWAAIALAVLEIAQPFVPPPYNLATAAAIVLLKLYLAREGPIRGDFAAAWPRDGPPWASNCVFLRPGSNLEPLMAPSLAA